MNPQLLILPLPSAPRITLTAGGGWPLLSKPVSVYGNAPSGQASGGEAGGRLVVGGDPAQNDGAGAGQSATGANTASGTSGKAPASGSGAASGEAVARRKAADPEAGAALEAPFAASAAVGCKRASR
ncbi:hypothetical protein I8J29_24375 [Paenibacillus sp. MWE-103]|uniref:Uncharacterized protein n=1 Tax=Paenibacillus artemisiicola TaxID=1172618 RepID=A0ABS3WGT0_9BACL|nr:hypothetical protein [Paenibacillus artemisiicola]MBO7747326.1 hypothetical protein [Paenibacillus artemisiicola]